MVQNRSRIGPNRSGMVPDTPRTLPDHFREKHFVSKNTQNQENVQTSQTRFLLESPFFPINVKSQWDFLTNRELELIYKARQMRNLEVIWYKHILFFFVSFLCVKSSRTHFWKVDFQAFSEKWVFWKMNGPHLTLEPNLHRTPWPPRNPLAQSA